MNQIYGSSDRDEAMILETLILDETGSGCVATGKKESITESGTGKTGSTRSLPPLP